MFKVQSSLFKLLLSLEIRCFPVVHQFTEWCDVLSTSRNKTNPNSRNVTCGVAGPIYKLVGGTNIYKSSLNATETVVQC